MNSHIYHIQLFDIHLLQNIDTNIFLAKKNNNPIIINCDSIIILCGRWNSLFFFQLFTWMQISFQSRHIAFPFLFHQFLPLYHNALKLFLRLILIVVYHIFYTCVFVLDIFHICMMTCFHPQGLLILCKMKSFDI